MSLINTTVVILGGSSGMGLATARAAQAEGARVVIAGRSRERLQAARAVLGDEVRTVALDIGDEMGTRALFSELGPVDHVFITAGAVLFDPKLAPDAASVRPALDTRFWGAFNAAKFAAANMAHRSSLSPDGRSVLVAEMGAGSAWLPCRLVPFDGSSEGREVGPANGGCTSAAWSRDGRWMYFSSNASGAFHIWRQAVPAGTPQQITFGASEEEGLAMAPDGRSLITAVGDGTSTVWIHDANGDRPLSEEGQGFFPQF